MLPGQTYVAAGGLHMKVDGSKRLPVIRLSEEPPENFCRPAVDVMFRSVARIYGAGVLAIVLTGIGADGTAGGRCIVEQGGVIIAQDEVSSVIWGMPGSAARAGICSAVLPLDVIADRVNALTAGVAT